MRRRIHTYIISLMAIFAGCSDVVLPSAAPEIVVEGWIEDGGYPVVILTQSFPVTTEYQDWSVLEDYMIRWAKVTINDGERDVVLTGGLNENYFPPYIYTTARMRGEAGKTYRITVEYSGRVETAETTIPRKVPLEHLRVVHSSEGYEIVASFKDDPKTKDYYRFFTMVENVDSTYVPSFLGLIDDSVLNDDTIDVQVNSSYVSNFRTIERSPMYYMEDDVVQIRFCTMDEISFNYWSDYDDVTSLSTNPFFPVNKKIRSNVSSGMGYWAGYGSSYYKVSIADSLALGRVW